MNSYEEFKKDLAKILKKAYKEEMSKRVKEGIAKSKEKKRALLDNKCQSL